VKVRRLFVGFLVWWGIMAWVIYSYAGEKMPWLTVHLALPMILLAAWGAGRFVESIDFRAVARERTWITALLAPPLVMAAGMLVYSAASGPFQGSSLAELTNTGQFLGSLLATLAFGAGIVTTIRKGPWERSLRVLVLVALVVPVLLTIRHAWHFCYVNYGYPIEHLVYAHAGPAVKHTMRQIEELSRRVVGGPELIEVAYGPDGSWPFHWYLRNYDNAVFYGEEPTREQVDAPVVIAGREQWEAVAPFVANDYIVNTYTYLWWPMEDYKNLSWERIREGLGNPKMRRALWRIWYDRDYRLYDEVTGKTHTLDEWPLRSEYRLYIRRDAIAKIWDRGTLGPGTLVDAEPYRENHLKLEARQVIGRQGSGRGELQGPRGLAIGDDGSLYVADGGNHRIQIFSSDGEYVDTWGGRSLSGEETGEARGFNEPWDVALGPEGSAYVADTWNHRVQKLDDQGTPITAWGVFGESTVDDGEAGQGLFYGPRGVVVGPDTVEPEEQRVYVADTGNKRIQVFQLDGEFDFQWGGGGSSEGSLDEPVGIAFGLEGDVYVADTWNRRIQVFDREGSFVRQWEIKAWDTGIPEEKPFLAVDSAGRVYVTDPGYYRVLVFDSQGNYLMSFGDYGEDRASFALPQGIAVGPDGSVYVSDAHNHRVLAFDPIDLEQVSD
jgi:DNA-binding beta-propeller fold protein YncE